MKKYTVVGYYSDNDQPFVGHEEADSPKQAADFCINDKPCLCVVEVFEGYRRGCLCNDEVLS